MTTTRIGLTGGIGSGKSTAANCFSSYGVPVIDADKISHQILRDNQTVIQSIVVYFGREFLINQHINKTRLREIIFQDSTKRQWLEQLLHPLIIAQMNKEAATYTNHTPYVVMIIPLLTLTIKKTLCLNRILVIDAPEDAQLQRIQDRDQISQTAGQQSIQTQATRQKRLAMADDVIVNDGSVDQLRQAILTLHEHYL